MSNFLEQAFGVVSIDNASNTLVDLSDQVMSISVSGNRNTSQFYTLGSDAANANDGKLSWSARLEFYVTDGANEAYQHLRSWFLPASGRPGKRTVQIDTPDGETGSSRLTGEARIGGLDPIINIDASSTDPMRVTATLTGDGVLTPSVIA